MKYYESNYFSYLLFSGVSSDLFRVLFFWWVISEYGGESLSSLLTVSTVLSFILLQLLSPLADFKSRRNILMLSSVLYSLSFLLMSVSSNFDELAVYIGVVSFLFVSSISTVSQPAQSGIIPDITTNERVPLLIRRSKLVTSSIAILGPVLAGYLGTISISSGFLMASIIMLVGALVSAKLPEKKVEPVKKDSEGWLQSIVAGWVIKKKAKVEFWFTFITAATNTLVTPFFMVLIPLSIKDKFSATSFSYGVAESSVAVGSLFAAAILLPFLSKKLKKIWICSVGMFLAGCGIILASLSDNLIVFTLSIPIVGAGIAVFSMNGMSHRLLAFPKEKRSRMAAIDLSIGRLTRVLGLSLTGGLIAFFDIGTIGLIYGIFILLFSFSLLVIPDWREFMSLNHDQLEGYFEKKYSI